MDSWRHAGGGTSHGVTVRRFEVAIGGAHRPRYRGPGDYSVQDVVSLLPRDRRSRPKSHAQDMVQRTGLCVLSRDGLLYSNNIGLYM